MSQANGSTEGYPYEFSTDPIQNRRDETRYLTDEPKTIAKAYSASSTASLERRSRARRHKLAYHAICVLLGALAGCGAALLLFAH